MLSRLRSRVNHATVVAYLEHALAWSRQMLRPEFRGPDKSFGSEIAVPADAPSYDRLAGWFGRDPAWRA